MDAMREGGEMIRTQKGYHEMNRGGFFGGVDRVPITGNGSTKWRYRPMDNDRIEVAPDSRHAARLRGKKARSWADKAMKR